MIQAAWMSVWPPSGR